MEKIKSILHSHGHDKDRETAGKATHDAKGTAAQPSTDTTGATARTGATPIYNEMTGQGTSTTGGTPSLSTTLNEDSTRPQVSSGAYDGNSDASIKSGVIGFTPGQAGQAHAALPNNSPVEDKLDRSQIVGQETTGVNTSSGLRNEITEDQPSVIPVSSGTGLDSSSTHQPYDSGRMNTDRSFPLSGGVTSEHHDHSSSAAGTYSSPALNTNEHELAGGDHHGREGLAGAAAAAAGTAAATHSHHAAGRDSQAGERIASPTGHTHMTTSVAEHNIHPDALHAAGARPVNDSTDPGHGPPYETPHINTGTLLDYDKAIGSDPHTQHTGLLDYRPHAHRTGTNPRVPGEFPANTPEVERAGPILGGAGTTSGTATTGPSTSHDLRHTGSLNDPTSRSTESSGHHLGRDAAIAGGVGAAGLGAAAHQRYEAPATGTGNLYDKQSPYSSKTLDPRVTGGESRLNEQRFDPTATSSASRTQPLTGSSAPAVPPKAEERQHHYGRDAAIGGGALGAGALAGSALAGDRHRDPTLTDSSSLPTTQHTTGTTNPSTVGTASTAHHLPSSTTAPSMHEQRYDPTAAAVHPSNPVPVTSEYNYQNPDVAALASATGAGALGHHNTATGQTEQPYTTAQLAQSASSQPPQAYKAPEIDSNDLGPRDNSSRNAALGAGAGLAGVGAVEYGHSQQPTTTPGSSTQLEKEREKDLNKHEKEAAKHEEKEEKSGGLLGFLHRDKSKKEKSTSPESSPRHSEDPHYGRDAAVAGGVGAGAADLAEHERYDNFGHGSGYKGRNLLHKDPPADHPAAQAVHADDRVGVGEPIASTSEQHYGRDAAVGGGALDAGVLGAHKLSKDRTEPDTFLNYSSSTPGVYSSGLTDDQTSTLPDRAGNEHHYGRDAAIGSGALGAGGLAAHELQDRRTDPISTTVGYQGTGLAGAQQATIPGNAASGSVLGDPNMISGDRQTQQGVYGAHPVEDLGKDRTVIEPRTGLPMNVGRYGDGAGGTDGGPIGHHYHETVPGQVQPGTVDAAHATTDWDDVAKKNTIY